jgi:hypothetical protein
MMNRRAGIRGVPSQDLADSMVAPDSQIVDFMPACGRLEIDL